jgi:hypothetical protein
MAEEPDMPNTNCNICGDLNFRPLPREAYTSRTFQRDMDLEDLFQAVRNGCESCHRLKKSVQQRLEVECGPQRDELARCERLEAALGKPVQYSSPMDSVQDGKQRRNT